jgi:hypothetical protein
MPGIHSMQREVKILKRNSDAAKLMNFSLAYRLRGRCHSYFSENDDEKVSLSLDDAFSNFAETAQGEIRLRWNEELYDNLGKF